MSDMSAAAAVFCFLAAGALGAPPAALGTFGLGSPAPPVALNPAAALAVLVPPAAVALGLTPPGTPVAPGLFDAAGLLMPAGPALDSKADLEAEGRAMRVWGAEDAASRAAASAFACKHTTCNNMSQHATTRGTQHDRNRAGTAWGSCATLIKYDEIGQLGRQDHMQLLSHYLLAAYLLLGKEGLKAEPCFLLSTTPVPPACLNLCDERGLLTPALHPKPSSHSSIPPESLCLHPPICCIPTGLQDSILASHKHCHAWVWLRALRCCSRCSILASTCIGSRHPQGNPIHIFRTPIIFGTHR